MAHQADATRMLDNRGYTGPLIRGQNPLTLLDAPLRDRVTESYYWKEQCFGLNAATLLDRAAELGAVGGTHGGESQKATPFLCLLFKLLQLTPERAVVDLYLDAGGDEWKYLRALAAMYLRLTGEPRDVYPRLEAFLADGRKIRRRTRDGYRLGFVDEFVDELLTRDRVCGVSLWKMPARTLLEDMDVLEPRVSPLGDEIDDLDDDDGEGSDGRNGRSGSEDGEAPEQS